MGQKTFLNHCIYIKHFRRFLMKKNLVLMQVLTTIAVIISISSIITTIYVTPRTANDIFDEKLSPNKVESLTIFNYKNREEIIISGSKSIPLLKTLGNSSYYKRTMLIEILRNGNYSYCITINYASGNQQSFEIFANDYAIYLDGKKYATNVMLNDLLLYYYD